MAEIIFIAAMMVLILIISFVAVYFFFKTYRKEMREKEARNNARNAEPQEDTPVAKEGVNGAP